jgi:DNA-binding NarL/FixJ family response regulator
VSTRVLIADDQALVRAGFRKLPESAPDTVVGGVRWPRGRRRTRRLRPSIVLMDIRMPRLDGIEATTADRLRRRRHTRPHPATFGLDDYVYDALRAGASGFRSDAPPRELLAAIEVVARGGALRAAVTRSVIEVRAPLTGAEQAPPLLDSSPPASARCSSCSPAACRTRRRRAPVVGGGTVKTHVAHVLEARSAPRAGSDRAYESGVITPGQAGWGSFGSGRRSSRETGGKRPAPEVAGRYLGGTLQSATTGAAAAVRPPTVPR